MAGSIDVTHGPVPGGRICVIGAGFMGCVIAVIYLRHGYEVVIHDVVPSMLDSFADRAAPIAAQVLAEGEDPKALLGRATAEPSLEAAVDGAFLVHEIVQEDLAVKRELFGRLDRICAPGVVLATNTSSILLSELATQITHKERVLGIHYVTPAHIVRVVELIRADFTPDELVEWGRRFLATIDHVGVVCAERPGFLVNRIQFAMLSEIYRLVDEGLASRDDIDAAVRLSLGPRLALWGPLLTEDLVVSKATARAVTDSLHDQTGDENFRSRAALRDLVAAGHQGALSGQGWYAFDKPYAETVTLRDRQLADLLEWLRDRDPVGELDPR